KEITGRDRNKLELKLKIIGSPVIRRYTANVSEDENYPEPDYESLTVIEGKDKKIPVIPGTSWAGAFRSHIEKMAKEMGIFPPNTAEKNRLGLAFGYVDKKTACAVKSKIIFSESKIKDSEAKLMTRTAIDRFSGGTVEGSLYTERIWYGGTTDLCIEFDGGIDEYVKQLLACAVLDLDAGILSVGGETSVGHGIFKIDKFVLNGQVITQFNPQSLTKNNDVGGGISEQ
ncbi:MAG: RAMP superfamily CRISPR-associated protein, partial [Anaerovorax sp.]